MEAVALRVDSDFKDRRWERGSSRTIYRERECVQGQGQGLASQHQDGGDNDGQPVPESDHHAAGHHPQCPEDELPEELCRCRAHRALREGVAHCVQGDQGGEGGSAGPHL